MTDEKVEDNVRERISAGLAQIRPVLDRELSEDRRQSAVAFLDNEIQQLQKQKQTQNISQADVFNIEQNILALRVRKERMSSVADAIDFFRTPAAADDLEKFLRGGELSDLLAQHVISLVEALTEFDLVKELEKNPVDRTAEYEFMQKHAVALLCLPFFPPLYPLGESQLNQLTAAIDSRLNTLQEENRLALAQSTIDDNEYEAFKEQQKRSNLNPLFGGVKVQLMQLHYDDLVRSLLVLEEEKGDDHASEQRIEQSKDLLRWQIAKHLSNDDDSDQMEATLLRSGDAGAQLKQRFEQYIADNFSVNVCIQKLSGSPASYEKMIEIVNNNRELRHGINEVNPNLLVELRCKYLVGSLAALGGDGAVAHPSIERKKESLKYQIAEHLSDVNSVETMRAAIREVNVVGLEDSINAYFRGYQANQQQIEAKREATELSFQEAESNHEKMLKAANVYATDLFIRFEEELRSGNHPAFSHHDIPVVCARFKEAVKSGRLASSGDINWFHQREASHEEKAKPGNEVNELFFRMQAVSETIKALGKSLPHGNEIGNTQEGVAYYNSRLLRTAQVLEKPRTVQRPGKPAETCTYLDIINNDKNSLAKNLFQTIKIVLCSVITFGQYMKSRKSISLQERGHARFWQPKSVDLAEALNEIKPKVQDEEKQGPQPPPP